jgi:SAM-dependent methyltransferase
VYAAGGWGEGETFDSGSGSRGEPAARYVDAVRSLIREHDVHTAVDIGCGDFRVAREFAGNLSHYRGVDVVPDLIARNRAVYGGSTVEFSVLDATREELPDAELCLIRQVLQHLSNRQISAILDRCARYPLVVVTEHWPAEAGRSTPNVDKPHGPDTRLDRGSWVDLTAAPLHRGPVEELLRVPAEPPLFHDGETIRTHLWRPACS